MRIAVLISGSGSNLQALIDACALPGAPAKIVLVVSNFGDAYGLTRAAKAGIETVTLDHRTYPTRADFEEALHDVLSDARIDFICLAGFMRLLSAFFVDRWQDRILNIHPSLLPAFPGLHVHQRAIDAGVRFSGCSVHVVRAGMDDGPIVLQAAVPVLQDDTAETLAARILESEHQIYPIALKLMASGRARVHGDRVFIDGETMSPPSVINPL